MLLRKLGIKRPSFLPLTYTQPSAFWGGGGGEAGSAAAVAMGT